MPDIVQLLNQFFLLWAPSVLFAGSALLLFRWRASWRGWLAWATALSAALAALLALRTPAGTFSRHAPAEENRGPILLQELVDLNSVQDIEAALVPSDQKPTLVEVYTDFGLS